MVTTYLPKGARIRARWTHTYLPCLAGAQMKMGVDVVEITGTVRHLRGDDPVNPKVVRLYVEVEGRVPNGLVLTRPYGCTCDTHDDLVEVDPDHVVEILAEDKNKSGNAKKTVP